MNRREFLIGCITLVFICLYLVIRKGREIPFEIKKYFEGRKGNNDIFSVSSYGAKGDGILDDTNAFQECANAIEKNGGGIFDIPYSKKGYCIKGTVHMPSNIIVKGNNAIIVANTSDNEKTPFYWTNKVNIIISNVHIDGKRKLKNHLISIGGGSNGLTFRGACNNITISSCTFVDTLEHGIHFMGEVKDGSKVVSRSSDVVIKGCLFLRNGNPKWKIEPRGAGIMMFYGVRNARVYNNTFKNFARIGIYMDSAHTDKRTLEKAYKNFSVEKGDYTGVNLNVSENKFIVDYDHGRYNQKTRGVAIAAHGQQNCKINNNIIEIPISSYRGISISDGQEHSPTKNIEIKDNKITATHEPVEVRNSSFISIINNKLEQVGGTKPTIGVYHYVSGDRIGVNKVSNIKISNNFIKNNSNSGILLSNNSDDPDHHSMVNIKDNSIVINDISNLSFGLKAGNINGLDIRRNNINGGYYGIFAKSGVTNVNIVENQIEGADRGIYSQGPVRCVLNYMKNCKTYGIQLTHPKSIKKSNKVLISPN